MREKRLAGLMWLIAAFFVWSNVLGGFVHPALGTAETVTTKGVLDWLEPQGLNIVDLVGQVPDSALAGMVISATPGYGILRYQSGQRTGNTLTITAIAYPRFVVDGSWNGSLLGCLGHPAKIDQKEYCTIRA